jgi:hypothetical protein
MPLKESVYTSSEKRELIKQWIGGSCGLHEDGTTASQRLAKDVPGMK